MSKIRNVVITGSNRGLGLEFVRQVIALPSPPENVFATCRDPSSADDLKKLASKSPGTVVHVEKLDASQSADLKALVSKVSSVVGDAGLNLLLNNAGLAERQNTLDDLTEEALTTSFKINTVAPLMITKAFLPLLKQAAGQVNGTALSASRAAVVNISTKMASLADNSSGGVYPYRISKTALNMATVNLRNELKPQGIVVLLYPGWVRTRMEGERGIIDTALNMATVNLRHELKPRGILVLLLYPGWVRTRMEGERGLIDTALNMATVNLRHELKPQGILVLLLHPGWVRTRMGGERGLIDVSESVAGMLKRITGSKGDDAGLFYDYKDDLIPW